MNILDICDFLLKSTLTIIRHKRRVGLGEMEKTIKNTTSMNVVLVDVTPEALREIANRMEMAARAAMPHEYTMVPLTGGITLCYKPEISRMNFIIARIQREAQMLYGYRRVERGSLGETEDGFARHPLMLPYDTPFELLETK